MPFELHHSTRWEVLQSIIQSEGIYPKPLKAVDRATSASAVPALAELGIEVSFFSSQAWSGNKFGNYILRYDPKDIVFGPLVELGEHNSGRCYLSVPPLLATWVANRTERSLIDTASNSIWRPKNRSDRVDILVGWRVPIAQSMYITDADQSKRSDLKKTMLFAQARYAAWALLSQYDRFDAALLDQGGLMMAGNLMTWLIGHSHRVFDRAKAEVTSKQLSNREYVLSGLKQLVENSYELAAKEVAHIGNYPAIANELAALIKPHFKLNLTGAEIVTEFNQ